MPDGRYLCLPRPTWLAVQHLASLARQKKWLSIETHVSKMFSSSKTRSHRESFGYRASKATSSKKQRSFKDLNRTSRIIAQAATQASPASLKSQQTPTSPLVLISFYKWLLLTDLFTLVR